MGFEQKDGTEVGAELEFVTALFRWDYTRSSMLSESVNHEAGREVAE
jgi:hypothetical protein